MDAENRGTIGSSLNNTPLDARDYLCLALLTMVWCFVASHHELAHDEAQAWNIARSAHEWWQVIWHSRYEGHTPLWFLVLWPVTQTGNPALMQVLAVLLGFLVATVLLRDKPFNRITCLALLLGYFIGFEYTIVARPYILTLLLCVVFASVFLRSGVQAFIVLCVLNALIGFTSSYGVLLSGALMCLLMAAWFSSEIVQKPPVSSVAFGVLIYVAAVVLAVYFIVWPIEERSFETAILAGDRVEAQNWSRAIETAAFPHWNRLPLGLGEWFQAHATGQGVRLFLSTAVAIAVFCLLATTPAAALSWLVAIALVTLGVLISGLKSERQMGHLFLAALILFWVQPALSGRLLGWQPGIRTVSLLRRSRLPAMSLVAGVLVYQFVVGVGVMAADVRIALSPWKQAAKHLKETMPERELSSLVLVTDSVYNAGALVARLDVDVYNMRCNCWSRYGVWQGNHIPDSQSDYALALRRAWCDIRADGREVLLVRTERHWPQDDLFTPILELSGGPRFRGKQSPVLYRLSGQLSGDRTALCSG